MAGGYEYQFVNTSLPDRFICVICYLPSRESYLTECCGHVFCKSCIDRTKASEYTDCPMCNDKRLVVFSNKQLDREIKSLNIYCTNKEKGCEWQGELNSINNHLGSSDGCKFEGVQCPNECGKVMLRLYLTNHVKIGCPRRKVNCQYCHDTGEHQFIEGQHKEECPKLPLPCPNNCEVGSVPRDNMKTHKKQCVTKMIQCEYYNMGCRARIPYKDEEKHRKEKMEEHLLMIKLKLSKTEDLLACTQQRLASSEERISKLETIVQEAMNKGGAKSYELVRTSLQWIVHVTTMSTMAGSGTLVCPVIIKMSQFTRRKEGSVQWYSHTFFTHSGGYRLCMCINATGTGDSKETHLSVNLLVAKGPHDDKLTWPLRGNFMVSLLNQMGNTEHHNVLFPLNNNPSPAGSRVTSGEYAKRGCETTTFISNEELFKSTTTCQFLKDDCIFFQVGVVHTQRAAASAVVIC